MLDVLFPAYLLRSAAESTAKKKFWNFLWVIWKTLQNKDGGMRVWVTWNTQWRSTKILIIFLCKMMKHFGLSKITRRTWDYKTSLLFWNLKCINHKSINVKEKCYRFAIWSIMKGILTVFSCALHHFLSCSWIHLGDPQLFHPEENTKIRLPILKVLKVHSFKVFFPYLLRVIPVQTGSFQNKPEALPLLGDEDAALLPLFPEPAVAVGMSQVPAGDSAPAQSCWHSWESTTNTKGKVSKLKLLKTFIFNFIVAFHPFFNLIVIQ